MPATALSSISAASCRHAGARAFVAEFAELCQPQAIHWCDGSAEESAALCAAQVAAGQLIALDPVRRPHCFLARSHVSDVARLESRTFLCTAREADAGPTNRWADPHAMLTTLRQRFAGCMRGRTLYVVPFCMAPLDSPVRLIGIELTDSPYVVINMRIMARIGLRVWEALGETGTFVPCLHSVGRPLQPGEADIAWPCVEDPAGKYIAHFPDPEAHGPAVWSFGSGYGGNALLGKKCIALRIASALAARDLRQGRRVWSAEHMLLMKLTPPADSGVRPVHIAAAFPSACGKTNLAMLRSQLPGWTATTLGDDIAWLHQGDDGRLWAQNPETGFFGVAPGTSQRTNPAALAACARDSIFTNVALTPEGDVWWEGLSVAPPQLIDWQGQPWQPGCGRLAAHPNARFTAPASACPSLDPAWDAPAGVPVDAILFGGRRATTVPLVLEARDFAHGVFLGLTTGSQTTSAATDVAAGAVRRDPFSMLPFLGLHLGDAVAHWLSVGQRLGACAPRIFQVNWFRTDASGRYLWPGFGDNARVLAWIALRLAGRVQVDATPIGGLPRPSDLPLAGLDLADGALTEVLRVDREGWRREAEAIAAWFADIDRDGRMPAAMHAELAGLRTRLA